jgi:hypothetical protein
MQLCLNRLDIPLKVTWIPKTDSAMHGEITSGKLLIYDADEKTAWFTFQHEIAEYKLQSVTRPYRLLANALIETIEKSIYARSLNFYPK